ncbi:MAG TPA: hypothetical protein VFW87_04705 [Pirellulales bacterium]|nr:hypothetical protein [Pirellulales bacterium]
MPRSLLFALIFIMGAGMAARSAEKNDPDAVSLAGVVTQPSGLPAAKAEVWLVTASMRGEPLVYDHVQADAEGKFRLILPGRWINNGATVRQELGIVAHQPGLAPAAICYWRTSTPNAANLRLELKPPSEAPVTIRAPDGRAVLGAKVSVTALICDVLRTDLTARNSLPRCRRRSSTLPTDLRSVGQPYCCQVI